MKFTLEIESNDENFSLSDLDWFTLEGGIYNKTEHSNEGKTKLFSYFFKCIDLKANFAIDQIDEGVKGLFFKCSNDIIEKDSNHIQMFEKLEKNLDIIQYDIKALNQKIEKLENSRISTSMFPKSTPSGPSIQSPPPPPPPPPPPQLFNSIVLKTNEIVTSKKKIEKNSKKRNGPTSVITLDEIKQVKLRKRSEVLNKTQ